MSKPFLQTENEDEQEPLQKITGAGTDPKVIPLGADREWFLRKSFEQNVEEGCTQVFRYYYASLCSHAVRYVYSKEIAEDIVGDVFREFWQKKHFLNISTSYRTYLFKAVRNRALNYLQREFTPDKELNADAPIAEKSPTPDEQVVFEQLYQHIQEEISKLPPQCQKVFLMSRFEGKSIKEIAELLQLSPRTIETHISKALSVLRAVLKSGDFISLFMMVNWLIYELLCIYDNSVLSFLNSTI